MEEQEQSMEEQEQSMEEQEQSTEEFSSLSVLAKSRISKLKVESKSKGKLSFASGAASVAAAAAEASAAVVTENSVEKVESKASETQKEICPLRDGLLEVMLKRNACPKICEENVTSKDQLLLQLLSKSEPTSLTKVKTSQENLLDENFSKWYLDFKEKRFGLPPSRKYFRTHKFLWLEKLAREKETNDLPPTKTRAFIHPFETKTKHVLSGGEKRRIIDKWEKMWDSALSDLEYARIVYEHCPEAALKFKTDKERIDAGCQKLCTIANLNQNVTTMLMRKFVSGPPGKLFSLNRLEAVQCWDRLINKNGVAKKTCCVELPDKKKKKFYIPSLKTPAAFRRKPDFLRRKSQPYRFPSKFLMKNYPQGHECAPKKEKRIGTKKKNSTYWLFPVPPVATDFRDEEFEIDPQYDHTGEIQRELRKAKVIAKRYTRFASTLERSKHIVPHQEKIDQALHEDFGHETGLENVRRKTAVKSLYSTAKMMESPEYRRDAVFTTLLSKHEHEDQPEGRKSKDFPYLLADSHKLKMQMTGKPNM